MFEWVNLFCCNFLWSLESSFIPIPIQVLLAITDIFVEPSALWRLYAGGLILEAIFSIRSALGFEHTTQKRKPSVRSLTDSLTTSPTERQATLHACYPFSGLAICLFWLWTCEEENKRHIRELSPSSCWSVVSSVQTSNVTRLCRLRVPYTGDKIIPVIRSVERIV